MSARPQTEVDLVWMTSVKTTDEPHKIRKAQFGF